MKKLLKKSKGFTLVELLIVIIIIGILAGMMLLATGSATDKAEATKIVANMRTIKSACLMYYADKGAWPGTDNIDSVSDYMDSKISTDIYSFANTKNTDDSAGTGLVIKADLSGTQFSSGMKGKLKGMAADSGLWTDEKCSTEYAGGDTAVMAIKKN